MSHSLPLAITGIVLAYGGCAIAYHALGVNSSNPWAWFGLIVGIVGVVLAVVGLS